VRARARRARRVARSIDTVTQRACGEEAKQVASVRRAHITVSVPVEGFEEFRREVGLFESCEGDERIDHRQVVEVSR